MNDRPDRAGIISQYTLGQNSHLPGGLRPRFTIRSLYASYSGKNVLEIGTHLPVLNYSDPATDKGPFTFEIPEGAITAILAQSGGGKTTLIKCLSKVEEMNQNSTLDVKADITFHTYDNRVHQQYNLYGADSIDGRTLRQRVGWVFQQPNLFTKTVYENVAFGLRVVHKIRDEKYIREIVHQSLEKAAILGEVDLNHTATRLSDGQKQRVCIARALAVSPDVLLMDEPTSKLDPENTAKIENTLDRLVSDGVAIVLVTHKPGQVARVAQRVAVFYGVQGKVVPRMVEYGDAGQIINNPKHPFTQAFITGRKIKSDEIFH